MPLMSIIGCEAFAKEISQLLGKDSDIERLIVINEKRSDIVKELDELGTRYELLAPDMLPPGLKKRDEFSVIVDLQSLLLHNEQSKIKKETYEKVKFYGKVSSGVLLLYDVRNDIFADIYSDFERSHFDIMTLKNGMSDKSKISGNLNVCISSRSGKETPDPDLIKIYLNSYDRLKEKLVR
ncbi:MAG: hypothetical protein AWU59_1987 [Methanolobus sp. T82-4]|nr:MAG: hypothetical protein AWU59_1987 [Methanolobus sp. T82-4]